MTLKPSVFGGDQWDGAITPVSTKSALFMIPIIGARGTTTTRFRTITATVPTALISAPACTLTSGINPSARPAHAA